MTACPRCQQPHDPAKCTGHSSRTGRQCAKYPIDGGTVCRFHGGAAPQVRRAAAARAATMAAHEAAERMVARAGVEADPIEHLLESLYRAAALVEVWGHMVADLDAAAEQDLNVRGREDAIRGEIGYTEVDDPDSRDELVVMPRDRLMVLNPKGFAMVHPYVTHYEQALERRAKFAKLCIDAGVAERQVRIAERQAALLAQVLRGVAMDLGFADHPELPAAMRRHLQLVTG